MGSWVKLWVLVIMMIICAGQALETYEEIEGRKVDVSGDNLKVMGIGLGSAIILCLFGCLFITVFCVLLACFGVIMALVGGLVCVSSIISAVFSFLCLIVLWVCLIVCLPCVCVLIAVVILIVLPSAGVNTAFL